VRLLLGVALLGVALLELTLLGLALTAAAFRPLTVEDWGGVAFGAGRLAVGGIATGSLLTRAGLVGRSSCDATLRRCLERTWAASLSVASLSVASLPVASLSVAWSRATLLPWAHANVQHSRLVAPVRAATDVRVPNPRGRPTGRPSSCLGDAPRCDPVRRLRRRGARR